MYWLNVDFPTNISKLHKEGCMYCRPKPSLNKELNGIGRYGGWIRFDSIEQAKTYHEDTHKNMTWQPCRICLPELVKHSL